MLNLSDIESTTDAFSKEKYNFSDIATSEEKKIIIGKQNDELVPLFAKNEFSTLGVGKTGSGKSRFAYFMIKLLLLFSRFGQTGGIAVTPHSDVYEWCERDCANHPYLADKVMFLNPSEFHRDEHVGVFRDSERGARSGIRYP